MATIFHDRARQEMLLGNTREKYILGIGKRGLSARFRELFRKDFAFEGFSFWSSKFKIHKTLKDLSKMSLITDRK